MDEEHELDKVMNNDINDIINKSIIKNLLNEEEEVVDDIPPLYKESTSLSTTTEKGVVIQLGDKFWGVEYEDTNSRSYGWVGLKGAHIYDPEYFKQPTDATYENSPFISELKKGTFVEVTKTTTIDIELKY